MLNVDPDISDKLGSIHLFDNNLKGTSLGNKKFKLCIFSQLVVHALCVSSICAHYHLKQIHYKMQNLFFLYCEVNAN